MSELTEETSVLKTNPEIQESKQSNSSIYTKSHYSSCHNLETLSSPSLDRQIDLVLKDYEK